MMPIEAKFKAKLSKSTQLTLVSSMAALETLIVLHQRLLDDLKQRAESILHIVKKEGKKLKKKKTGVRSSGRRGDYKSPTKSSGSRARSRSPMKAVKDPKGDGKGSEKGKIGIAKTQLTSPKAVSPLSSPSFSKKSAKDTLNSSSTNPLGGESSGPTQSSEENSDQVLEQPETHVMLAQQETEGAVIQLFDEYGAHFKMYFRYVQNYPKLALDLSGDINSKSLKKFIADACKRNRQHGILSLLILPIQRIPRYLLLLESLDKSTPTLHLHLPRLESTISKLRVVTKAIDECQRQSDNSLKLFTLQTTLMGAPQDLQILTPSREFIKQDKLLFLQAEKLGGEIDETKLSQAEKVNLLLFNDLLMLMSSKKNEYIKHFFLHDVTIYEGKSRAVWDLCTGSPELLYGRVMFNSRSELKKWNSIAFPVVDQAKETHMFHTQQKLSKQASKSSVIDRVNVYLRVRPFITTAEKELKEKCLSLEGDTMATLHRPSTGGGPSERVRERVAVFDHCFSENSSQSEVFNRVGEEVLGSVFCGYNCAIIAYGNTGSGKTHTIFGGEEEQKGLLPRVLEELFTILKRENWYKSQISVSYVQIYCNKLYDLQGSEKHIQTPLKIIKKKDTHEVSGVVKTHIRSVREAMKIIEAGNEKRVTRAHKMNDSSSRSHSVFTIHCQLHNAKKDATTKTILQLVDLAGSENIKETGVEGVALTESMHINRSLTSLGRALHAVLSNEGKSSQKKQVISFRETTLTHMLSDVLSGNFVCSLILTASASPAHRQAELTSKTLAFGMGAKRIDVRASPNKAIKESRLTHFLSGVWRTVTWG